jgi:hypothetical protein
MPRQASPPSSFTWGAPCASSCHSSLTPSPSPVHRRADGKQIISQINLDVEEAKDNLLQAKIFQAHYANKHRAPELEYAIGDKVMLSTLHRRNEYKKKGEKHVAKFFPRYDGPYLVVDKHPEASMYTLELPNSPNVFPTYHASELV